MLRNSSIFSGLLLWLLVVAAPAAERDILEISQEHPKNITVDGVPAKYGDPNLAAAVEALADLPRPWTVPVILAQFEKENGAWLRKLQAQIQKKDGQMWKGWEQESVRCGHLATLLAASRDPRAGVVLGEIFAGKATYPGGVSILEGLFNYFVNDPRYRQLPAKPGPRFSTNLYWEWSDDIHQWWKLNEADLRAAARALEK